MLSRKVGTWDAPGVLALYERMNSVAWSSGTIAARVTLALPQSRALLSSLCYTAKVSFVALWEILSRDCAHTQASVFPTRGRALVLTSL